MARGDILTYLDKWEKSVKDRSGFDADAKRRMQLSSETLLGLRMTGKQNTKVQ